MIKIDESDPVGEVDPSFPIRDVVIKKGTDMKQFYELQKEIGRGKFGTVYRCTEKSTGLKLAAKFINTSKRQDRRNAEREVELMRELQHPRLIQMYDAYEINNMMCVILELIEGGELFERVIDDDFVLTEKSVSVFMKQICEGVAFIHSKNILHLDMKPENILCLSRNGNRIKIIDFGLARKYDPEKKMQVLFGTPEFVAPEVVNFDSIGFGTDMWSVGVICYVLLSGLSPFMGETDMQTMANVTIAQYDFDDEAFNDISKDAKDFIAKLLLKDREVRMSATECLSHRWLQRRTCIESPCNGSISQEHTNASQKVNNKNNKSELEYQKDTLRNIVDRWNDEANALPARAIANGDHDDRNSMDVLSEETNTLESNIQQSTISSQEQPETKLTKTKKTKKSEGDVFAAPSKKKTKKSQSQNKVPEGAENTIEEQNAKEVPLVSTQGALNPHNDSLVNTKQEPSATEVNATAHARDIKPNTKILVDNIELITSDKESTKEKTLVKIEDKKSSLNVTKEVKSPDDQVTKISSRGPPPWPTANKDLKQAPKMEIEEVNLEIPPPQSTKTTPTTTSTESLTNETAPDVKKASSPKPVIKSISKTNLATTIDQPSPEFKKVSSPKPKSRSDTIREQLAPEVKKAASPTPEAKPISEVKKFPSPKPEAKLIQTTETKIDQPTSEMKKMPSPKPKVRSEITTEQLAPEVKKAPSPTPEAKSVPTTETKINQPTSEIKKVSSPKPKVRSETIKEQLAPEVEKAPSPTPESKSILTQTKASNPKPSAKSVPTQINEETTIEKPVPEMKKASSPKAKVRSETIKDQLAPEIKKSQSPIPESKSILTQTKASSPKPDAKSVPTQINEEMKTEKAVPEMKKASSPKPKARSVTKEQLAPEVNKVPSPTPESKSVLTQANEKRVPKLKRSPSPKPETKSVPSQANTETTIGKLTPPSTEAKSIPTTINSEIINNKATLTEALSGSTIPALAVPPKEISISTNTLQLDTLEKSPSSDHLKVVRKVKSKSVSPKVSRKADAERPRSCLEDPAKAKLPLEPKVKPTKLVTNVTETAKSVFSQGSSAIPKECNQMKPPTSPHQKTQSITNTTNHSSSEVKNGNACTRSSSTKSVQVEVNDESYHCVKKRTFVIKNITKNNEIDAPQQAKKAPSPGQNSSSTSDEENENVSNVALRRRISDITSLLSKGEHTNRSMDEVTSLCNSLKQIVRLRQDNISKSKSEGSSSKRPKFRISCFSRDVPLANTNSCQANLLNYSPLNGEDTQTSTSWTNHSDPASLRNSPERERSAAPSLTRKILSKLFRDSMEYDLTGVPSSPNSMTKDKLTGLIS